MRKLLLTHPFFARKDKCNENQNNAMPTGNWPRAGKSVQFWGRGWGRGVLAFGDHVRAKAGFRVCDVFAKGSYEVGISPYGGVIPKGGDIVQ